MFEQSRRAKGMSSRMALQAPPSWAPCVLAVVYTDLQVKVQHGRGSGLQQPPRQSLCNSADRTNCLEM